MGWADRPYWAKLVLIAAAYLALGRLGLSLALPPGKATAVWLPSGLALAVVLLWGYRLWPGILAGAFAVNFLDFFQRSNHSALAAHASISMIIASGSTAQALLGAMILNYASVSRWFLQCLEDFLRFAAVALVMCLTACSCGVTGMALLGFIGWPEYLANWWTWWLGDVAGVLVGAPFIVIWSRESHPRLSQGKYAEAVLGLVLLATVGLIAFGGWGPVGAANYPLVFFFEALLLWAALRFGRHGAATITLLASLLAVTGTVWGTGPFVGRTLYESLLLLQSFTVITSVVAWALAIVLFENQQAVKQLRQLNEILEKQVAERTAQAERWAQELRERHQLEADLQQSQERTELIIETVHEAYIKMDAAGVIAGWNAEAEKTFGWSRGEAIGRELAETIIPLRHREEYRHGLKQFLATGNASLLRRRFELTGLHRDGHEFPMEIAIAPRRAGDTYVFNAFLHDISARKRFEEALARSNTELQQFAYVASHDLQEPLRAVAGFCELLAEKYHGQFDAKGQQWLGFIVDGARHMQALVQGLLQFSRVQTDGKPLVATSAGDAVNRAVHNLKALMEENQAEIVCGDLPAVPADPWQLVTVFQNLIANAIKFRSEQPPRVQIGAERHGDHWVFQVRDNGIGIDPKHHKRLFIMFQRLHRRQEYPGAGIGLALCKRIVERHGGRIWVESEAGKGCALFFSIPTAQETGDEYATVAYGKNSGNLAG